MPAQQEHIRFTKRTIPIPADYRPLYKIGHILLILHFTCRGGKGSLMKLHFLAWAIKSKRNIHTVREWVKTNFTADFHIWGVEPTVNRALLLAISDKMIREEKGGFVIEPRGLSYVQLILDEKMMVADEREFLVELGKNSITEAKIKELSLKMF